ncbi:MAG: glycosyltransferase family 39 protein, partial [bacterium]|nr:glycosyltransferase family 39 protein [bacterium]
MNKLLLLVIIVIAILIRFWQLGNVPPSPDWDEASLGYNAYSIMLTGKDEYGKFLPIILRSFDDYKPALYAYLIIPFIKIFGLNIISVRLPAAIFGVLGVLATYFLVRELFERWEAGRVKLDNDMRSENKKSNVSLQNLASSIPLLTSFLLAISPWHVHFSRVAFETQVGLVFNIFSILFFLKGLKNGFYLFISAVFAAASIYVYQSEKVYIPILFFVLALIYRKDIFGISKKWLISALLFGAILVFPMFWNLVSDPNSLMRARGVSVFSDQTQFLKRNVQKLEQDKKNNDYLGMILDNRRVEYSKSIISGYISHWNLNWLFITGDIDRHHAPFMGLMYLVELPFLLAGIYFLLFGDYPKKTKLTVLALFLIAPIPASVTSGVPHAVRAINFLPTFQIFTAIGLLSAFAFVSNIKYQTLPAGRLVAKIHIKYFIFSLCILFFIFNILYYLNQYFVQQNYYYSQAWQYGYKQTIDFIVPIKNRYEKIVVSNVSPLDQSYMFFLYYLKFDPASYQKSGGTLSGGFKEEHKGFDKFTFKEIVWGNEKKEKTLFVGTM